MKSTEKDNKAQCQYAAPNSETECERTGKTAVKNAKRAANDAAGDISAAGKNVKTAAKEMVADAVKSGKEMCAASEKAVLEATDKALRATSHATAKASKSVRKTLNS